VISRFVDRLIRMRMLVVTGLALSIVLSASGLVAQAAPGPAVTGTQLPFSDASLAVDPVGQHVFAAGGPGNSSIVVLDFNGNVVTTITGEQGASGMALDPANHTLYVALADANAISEIDTTTLTETARFSTGAFTTPYKPVIAGGKLWIATEGGLATANLDGTGLTSAGLPAAVGLPDFSKSVPAASSDGNLLAVVAPFQSLTEVGVFDVSMKAPNLVSFAWDPNTGANAADLAFDASGQNVLMAAAAPYYVQPLDTRTLQSTGTYQTGPYPDAVAASPGGKYVAGAIWNPYSPNFYLHRSDDPTPIQSWTLPNYRPNPYGLPSSRVFSPLAFSPDGAELFAVAGGQFYVLPTLDGPDTTVSLTSAPNDETFATAASFDFSSPDNSVSFECSLDNAPAQPCTSPASYSGLAAGLHTFQVQAVDANGVEGSTGQTWMVEALDTTVFGGPQTKYSTTASFSFSSHDDNATFECNLDSSGWTPCTSPAAYSQLAFGAHSFDVRAVDGGLVDQTGAGQTWTVKPPDTMLNGEPPPSTYTTNAAFSFWSHAWYATFECSLDGSDWAACTAPVSYTGLPLGTHVFKVRAVNDAGAADPVGVTYTWTINPPDTFLSSTPADPSYSTSAAFSFLSHAPNATFQCSLDGASWAACTSPTSYQGLALGTHTFDVRAVDALAVDPFGSSYTWTIASGHPLNVTTTGVAGMVTSSPTGINCGSSCSAWYAAGTKVTLTATPSAGAAFNGWSGACSGVGACVVTMSQAQAVTANFVLPGSPMLTVTRVGPGTVSSNPSGINCGSKCSQTYKRGTAVTLTAKAAAGSVFTGWSGACTGTSSKCHLSMTAARATTATFVAVKPLTVTVAGSGRGRVKSSPAGISCSSGKCVHPFPAATVVTLTATAKSGSTFTGWAGACTGAGNCIVTMSAAKKVKATFAAARH
jgi:hypothetical protein